MYQDYYSPIDTTAFQNYIYDMTDIRKFVTDLEKIKKIFRQNNSGQRDYNKLQKDTRNPFERSTSCHTGLPASIFEYWENQYIYKSADLGEEPTADNINKLAAFLAFLENTDEYQELITDEDWEEIGPLVNYEAEDLPVDILQNLMMILVSHGVY